MTRGTAKKGKNPVAEKFELFDLANDANETTDLAAKQPEKLAAMKAKLAEISKSDRDAVAND
jgi:arylsulfatase A-like enzyme